MKMIMMTMAAVSALAMAAPAAAQYATGNFDARISQLQTNLQAGVQSGRITRDEAVPLREQLRQLSRLERHYSRDGLSRGESDQLRQRIQTLRQHTRYAERNGDNRPRYDRDDRYANGRDCPPGLARKNNGCMPPGQVGRDDRWSDSDSRGRVRMMDRNRDGYDDRYDRYENGRYEDGRYEDRDTQRGGIGGLIDNLLGGGGLRVGQRVTGDLGAVPYAYRDRFRDGNGAYYRADSRSIYQVDARNDTVVRIYPFNR